MNTRVFTPYSTIMKTSKVIRVLLSIHSLQMCVHVSVLYILVCVYAAMYMHCETYYNTYPPHRDSCSQGLHCPEELHLLPSQSQTRVHKCLMLLSRSQLH